jgi:intein-encoded DNA endonuclease-like protein
MNKEWSSDFAYCVGLIATDGCLYSDGRHICFTSKDIELIETFSNALHLSAKIGHTVSGSTGRKTSRIQWSDIQLHAYLISIGITPHKSKTLKGVEIPAKYFFDFLRGLFDGDGSFYNYNDKRFGTLLWYLTFNSASKKHIEWLRKELEKLLGIKGHISKAIKSSVYSL